MSEALYLRDSYLKEFEAIVKSVKDGKYIVLDKTIFYPNSGGQLYDTGKLIKNNEDFNVIYVGKFNNEISHEVDKQGLKIGDKVKGAIDWGRRYKLMRSHTASHVLSGVFNKDASALITGNQLELDKCRIDFNLGNFDREKINDYVNNTNDILKKNLPIKIYFISRKEALVDNSLFKLAVGFKHDIKEIRIVEIGNFDKQADGGTHVKNTSECGAIELIKCENKGRDNRRVYWRLKDG